MATRFYLQSSGSPDVNPAFDGGWERTSEADRLPCSTSKLSTAMTNFNATTQVATDDYDTLAAQFVSAKLAAQTISGTIKGQIRCLESNALANFSRAIVVKVVSEDGSTVRGTLLSDFSDSGTEFNASTLTNRNFPPSAALSSVDAQEGDRIVIEIGARKNGTSSSTRTANFSIGDDSGSDLPENETETNPNNPWIEFSANLSFYSPPAPGVNVAIPTRGVLQVLLYDENFNLKRELNEFASLFWEFYRVGGCGQCSFSMIRSASDHERILAPRTSVRIVMDGETRYQGQIAKYGRDVRTGTELLSPVFFGYLLDLDGVIVRRDYENVEVSEIVKDIMDLDVVPNSNVSYLNSDVDVSDYVVQSVSFNHTVKDAFSLLGQLAGNFEWGVDRNRRLYFKRPDNVVRRAWVLGREIQQFQEERSFEAVRNLVNVFGSGGLLGTVRSSLSQSVFGRKEANVFESSISEASDGNRIASINIKRFGTSQRRTSFSYMKEDEFLERSMPMGAGAITTSTIRRLKKYGASTASRTNKYGKETAAYPNKYGNLVNDQVDSVRYSLSGKGLSVGVSLSEDIPSMADQQRRVEYEIKDLQRR